MCVELDIGLFRKSCVVLNRLLLARRAYNSVAFSVAAMDPSLNKFTIYFIRNSCGNPLISLTLVCMIAAPLVA